MVTLHAPVPVQLPLQPVNEEPDAGAALRLTAVPLLNEALQVVPQLMPAGVLVTLPVPAPPLFTLSPNVCSPNVAVTDVAALMVTLQVLVPVQPPPLQPVKTEPAAGEAVRTTAVAPLNEAVQVVPQLMPAGELVTVPLPLPDLATVKPNVGCVKVAVTDVAALTVTVQVPVPAQPPPLQPMKVEPVAAAALNVTDVPFVNAAEHVAPQLMPAGALVTVPLPLPVLVTVNVDPFDTPVPVTSREIVSPSALKLTLVLAAVVLVGVNRTVTVAVAPVPTRVNGLPEAMENGAGTVAAPVIVPPRVLVTVKVWVAELPMLTLPNAVVLGGVTAKSICATAPAAGEQLLSAPSVSTAVTETL